MGRTRVKIYVTVLVLMALLMTIWYVGWYKNKDTGSKGTLVNADAYETGNCLNTDSSLNLSGKMAGQMSDE